MSLLRILLVFVFVAAGASCAGTPPASNEPATAKEKQLQAMKASGDGDETNTGKWKMWRYTGDRAECYYAIGRRCFKTLKAACATTACRASSCDTTGAGPAMVTCKLDPKPAQERPAKTP